VELGLSWQHGRGGSPGPLQLLRALQCSAERRSLRLHAFQAEAGSGSNGGVPVCVQLMWAGEGAAPANLMDHALAVMHF
jgi:hypothetical protein